LLYLLQVVERGATFKKRNFTLGGFALQTKKVFVRVKQEEGNCALVYRYLPPSLLPYTSSPPLAIFA
jgi:hypothetical protein